MIYTNTMRKSVIFTLFPHKCAFPPDSCCCYCPYCSSGVPSLVWYALPDIVWSLWSGVLSLVCSLSGIVSSIWSGALSLDWCALSSLVTNDFHGHHPAFTLQPAKPLLRNDCNWFLASVVPATEGPSYLAAATEGSSPRLLAGETVLELSLLGEARMTGCSYI